MALQCRAEFLAGGWKAGPDDIQSMTATGIADAGANVFEEVPEPGVAMVSESSSA